MEKSADRVPPKALAVEQAIVVNASPDVFQETQVDEGLNINGLQWTEEQALWYG